MELRRGIVSKHQDSEWEREWIGLLTPTNCCSFSLFIEANMACMCAGNWDGPGTGPVVDELCPLA